LWPLINEMVTRCYRYALVPSQVQAEAFDRAAVAAKRYWNALVAAQRYAEEEIRAGRAATIVGKLEKLLQAKKLAGRAVTIAKQRATGAGLSAEEAIRLLRSEKAAELGRTVKSKDGRSLRRIGRRRLATEYAVERVEKTRKVKGSSLAQAVPYALVKRFRECCNLYIRGKRGRPKFKRFRDSISVQVQIQRTTPIPLVETHVDFGRIAGPLVGRVKVTLHRPLPGGARIKQMSLTCRNHRYYVVLVIDFEPEPTRTTMTGRVAGIDPGRKLALAVASLDGKDEEVFQPPLGRDKRWLRRLRRLQRKADRQRRTNNPDCFDTEGRWIPGRRLNIDSAAQAATKRMIADMEEHLAAVRLDYYHRAANSLLERFDVIGIGAWRGRGRAPGCGRARRAQNRKDYDHAISLFAGILKYKALERNKLALTIKEAGSTRGCERCGQATGPRGLKDLNVREWVCLVCGHRQHRDFAAARAHARKAAETAAVAFTEQPALKTFGAKSASAPPGEATKVMSCNDVKVPVADEAETVRSASHGSSRGGSAAVLAQPQRAARGSPGAVAQGDKGICLRGHDGQPGLAGRPLKSGAMICGCCWPLRNRPTSPLGERRTKEKGPSA
jgi:transposase